MTKRRSHSAKRKEVPHDPDRRKLLIAGGSVVALGLFGVLAPAIFRKSPLIPSGVSPALVPPVPSYGAGYDVSQQSSDPTILFDALPSTISDFTLEGMIETYKNRTYEADVFARRREEILRLTTFNKINEPPLRVEHVAEIRQEGYTYHLWRHQDAEEDLAKLGSRYQEFLDFVHHVIQQGIVHTRDAFVGPVREFDFIFQHLDLGTNNETLPLSSFVRLNTARWVKYFLREANTYDLESLSATLEHELYHVHSFVTTRFYGQNPLARPKFLREFPAMFAEIDGRAVARGEHVTEELIRKELDINFTFMRRRRVKINKDMRIGGDDQTYVPQATRAVGFYVAGVALRSLGSEKRFHAYLAGLMHEPLDSIDAFNELNRRFDIRTSRGVLTYDQAIAGVQALYNSI